MPSWSTQFRQRHCSKEIHRYVSIKVAASGPTAAWAFGAAGPQCFWNQAPACGRRLKSCGTATTKTPETQRDRGHRGTQGKIEEKHKVNKTPNSPRGRSGGNEKSSQPEKNLADSGTAALGCVLLVLGYIASRKGNVILQYPIDLTQNPPTVSNGQTLSPSLQDNPEFVGALGAGVHN